MNSVSIIGNLTRDPETKVLSSTTITRFSIAVNKLSKDKGTNFFDVDVFGKTAETCAKYLTKGKKVAVVGRLEQETWETDGQKRSKIKIVANSVDFLTLTGETEPKEKAEITQDNTEDESAPF